MKLRIQWVLTCRSSAELIPAASMETTFNEQRRANRRRRRHGTIETKTIEIKCTKRVGVLAAPGPGAHLRACRIRTGWFASGRKFMWRNDYQYHGGLIKAADQLGIISRIRI